MSAWRHARYIVYVIHDQKHTLQIDINADWFSKQVCILGPSGICDRLGISGKPPVNSKDTEINLRWSEIPNLPGGGEYTQIPYSMHTSACCLASYPPPPPPPGPCQYPGSAPGSILKAMLVVVKINVKLLYIMLKGNHSFNHPVYWCLNGFRTESPVISMPLCYREPGLGLHKNYCPACSHKHATTPSKYKLTILRVQI